MDFYVKNGLINQNGRDIRIDTLYVMIICRYKKD